MKPFTLLTFALVFALACERKPEKRVLPTVACHSYLTYDKVEHYWIGQDDDDDDATYMSLADKKNKTAEEEQICNLILSDDYKTLADTIGFMNLVNLGYKKAVVPRQYFREVNDVFCRPMRATQIRRCIPIYRDLLIFKRAGSIVGYVRICFGCTIYAFVGTQPDSYRYYNGAYMDLLSNALGKKLR